MAISRVPTDWIANYSYSAPNITIPLASFSGLSAAEAHTSTGDIANILKEIIETAYAKQQALAAADRPTKMTISRVTQTNDQTGVQTRQFTLTFTCDAPALDVSAES